MASKLPGDSDSKAASIGRTGVIPSLCNYEAFQGIEAQEQCLRPCRCVPRLFSERRDERDPRPTGQRQASFLQCDKSHQLTSPFQDANRLSGSVTCGRCRHPRIDPGGPSSWDSANVRPLVRGSSAASVWWARTAVRAKHVARPRCIFNSSVDARESAT